MKPRYQIHIHFDGVQYVATVPDFPGCAGVGASYIEAVAAAEAAIVQWITDAISSGGAVPAPSMAGVKPAKARKVAELVPCAVPATNADSMQSTLNELVTDAYSFRRRHHRSQMGFWERFGVGQSTGSRYEQRSAKRRTLPLPLAMLVGLWALGRVDDRSLAEVYAVLMAHYPDRPHLALLASLMDGAESRCVDH